MALREIVLLPDPVLRRKAHKVTVFDKDLQTLIDDMIETMRDAPGVGLAAPQVGESIRLLVIEYGEEPEDEDIEPGQPDPQDTKPLPMKLFVVINPEIVMESEEVEVATEGCLSVPNLVGDVERALSIEVKALNRRGKPVKIKASGWLARIFQHEIDHLDGIIYTDRAIRVWKPREGDETPVD